MTDLNLTTVARALGGDISNGQVLAPGPGHTPKDRSMSVNLDSAAPDGFVVNSFSGDDPLQCKDYVREKLGLPAFKPNGGRRRRASAGLHCKNDAGGSSATDHIKANDSKLSRPMTTSMPMVDCFTKYVDLSRKDFDSDDRTARIGFGILDDPKYPGSLNGRRVLYRLPELLKFPHGTVFITEGEKDCDRVRDLDLCATTVAAGKWTDDCVKALKDRDVVILRGRRRPRQTKGACGCASTSWHRNDDSRCLVAGLARQRRR